MAIAQVVAGARILISDLNAYYSLLKGSTGETVTLAYNAAGSIIIQPSSDPSAGTEAIQVKNNAGTVQSALSYDGRFYPADGLVATPGIAFESDKDTGIWRSTTNTLDISAGGVRAAQFIAAASSVDYLLIAGVATGNTPSIQALGTDTDVGISLQTKAAGVVNVISSTLANYIEMSPATGGVGVNISAKGTDASINLKLTPKGAAGIVDMNYATVALGAGGAATLGLTGGSGPGTTTQNSWLKVNIAGTASYLPVWR